MERNTAQEMERSYNPMEFYREVKKWIDGYYPKGNNYLSDELESVLFLEGLNKIIEEESEKIEKSNIENAKEKIEGLKSAYNIIVPLPTAIRLIGLIHSLELNGYKTKGIEEITKEDLYLNDKENNILSLEEKAELYRKEFWDGITNEDKKSILSEITKYLESNDASQTQKALILTELFLPGEYRFVVYTNIINKIKKEKRNLYRRETIKLLNKLEETYKRLLSNIDNTKLYEIKVY